MRYDSLYNNWEELLFRLCDMSDHIDDYRTNLNEMLSDVDKEICDLMHYLELNDLDEKHMLEASRMRQERQRHRREIEDEMEKTNSMKASFLDTSFKIKEQQSLEFMERMKMRNIHATKAE